jgi:hypothetical protein
MRIAYFPFIIGQLFADSFPEKSPKFDMSRTRANVEYPSENGRGKSNGQFLLDSFPIGIGARLKIQFKSSTYGENNRLRHCPR